MRKKNVTVIFLAGGSGTRMNSEIPKQFLMLGGIPIFQHSLNTFLRLSDLAEIVIVCSEKFRHFFKLEIPHTFVEPGERRQDSVYHGLQAANVTSNYLCIHDAARPYVDLEMIKNTIQAAKECGASAAAMPLKFTVKQTDRQGYVSNTPERSMMWEVQTPQVIQRDLLVEAFKNAIEKQLDVTDDVSLVEQLGHPVKLVMGNAINLKITTPEDLIFAESLHR